jgi:tetratricopeptide (TPR) repeat protein
MWVRLALVVLLAAAPSYSAAAPLAGVAGAEQTTAPGRDEAGRAAALERLFESLREAGTPEIGRGIEQLIWSIWLTAGGDEADRLMALSVQAMSAHDLATARMHLDALIALDPGYAEAWNKRATISFLEGDFAASLADIERTLALEPRHFGALSGLGMILERMDEKAGALKAFRDALAIHPQMPTVRSRVEALSVEVEGQDL